MAKLQDIILPPDTRANQPAAAAVGEGAIYCVTDEDNILERSNGTTWDPFSPSGAPSGVILADGSVPMAADLDLDGNKVTNLDTPTAADDAVPKSYADARGWVLLEERTAASSASLDFTTRNKNGFSGATFQSDFDLYVIELQNVVPASSGHLLMRMSTNGGSSYDSGANYGFAAFVNNTADFEDHASVSAAGQTSHMVMPDVHATTANGGCDGEITIRNPLNASQHKKYIQRTCSVLADGQFYNGSGAGRYVSTTAVNALQFFFPSINMASGVIRIYGVPK